MGYFPACYTESLESAKERAAKAAAAPIVEQGGGVVGEGCSSKTGCYPQGDVIRSTRKNLHILYLYLPATRSCLAIPMLVHDQ